MRLAVRALGSLVVAGALHGCASTPPSTPVLFDHAPVPTDVPLNVNWPHAPITSFEQLQALDRDTITSRHVKGAGAGVTGARKVRFGLKHANELYTVKGKPVPSDLDSTNNSPRREIAAYQIQLLFLDPIDFVVPFSTLRCIPHRGWEETEPARPSSVPGTECVLVNLSFWLDDVTLPDPLYDPQRFLRDANYAYHLGNFNLLSYLIQARDSRKGNVLVSIHEEDRRVFAIDNGISFSARIFNWFVPETYAWQNIRVPAVPKRAVERLRALERADLDVLSTVIQMNPDEAGILRVVRPDPPFDDAHDGVRIKNRSVQLGLEDDELDDLWERITKLLARIDAGEIGTF